MIRQLPRSSRYQIMKHGIVLVLVLYSVLTSAVLFRLNPHPLVIGIDPFGTRVLGSGKDPILKAEKENFLKRFIIYLYNYDETNFDDRISVVGDFMNPKLWDLKKPEFVSISNQLKTESLTQKAKILDLREVDETHFEVDVEVSIQSKLRSSNLKIRASLELSPSPRTATKPYPWEVIRYDEQTSN